MTRFWSIVADFANWLLNFAVDRGAYDDGDAEDMIEAATLAACARDQEIYDHGKSDGYLEGLDDASRRNAARMQ